jgi:rhamnogalacturonyl hydrolase YesR
MGEKVNTSQVNVSNQRQENIPLFEQSLDQVLKWAHTQKYEGYSKFDVFNSPIMRALSLNNRYIRLLMTAAWSRMPINVRPLVLTERSRNPKGIGLFALAYLRRYYRCSSQNDLDIAVELLDWLDENYSQGYTGKCWGYDHDWQSIHFYAPKYSPNIVVTGNVVYAFLEAYEMTKEQRYLDIARSSVDFILKDLETPFQTPEMRNIGYVPGNKWAVLNINGMAAAILIWVWQHTAEPHLKTEAQRLIAFLADKQTDYGAWHYAWPANTSNVKHDNYHTGNVLDWILEYSLRSGDRQFISNYERGMVFYREHLFREDGAPKWMSHKDYPFDAHSAGQAIVTFTKAAVGLDPLYLDQARRVAKWAIKHLQAPAGYFYYQQGRFWTKRYTLMRWCNGWMAYGLSSLLLAEHKLVGSQR